MWLKAKVVLKCRGIEDVAGDMKAVVELADTIHAQIAGARVGKPGLEGMKNLTKAELCQFIEHDLRGGEISYRDPILSLPTSTSLKDDPGWNIRPWLAKEWAWTLAFTLLSIGSVFVGWQVRVASFYIVIASAFMTGIALVVGSTHGSRAIMIIWMVPVIYIMPQVLLSQYAAEVR